MLDENLNLTNKRIIASEARRPEKGGKIINVLDLLE